MTLAGWILILAFTGILIALTKPVGLWLSCPRTAEAYTAPVSLRVQATDDVTDVLQRALLRSPAHRFDPVVCTDPTGAVVGLLRVEDLANAAAGR